MGVEESALVKNRNSLHQSQHNKFNFYKIIVIFNVIFILSPNKTINMKFMILILALGTFAFSSTTSHQYEVVDATEKAQLFEEIETQLDIVDKVISVELQQDSEGTYYYEVKGNKAGAIVSFNVATSSSAAGGCSCRNDGALALSPHFFWVCIVPCF